MQRPGAESEEVGMKKWVEALVCSDPGPCQPCWGWGWISSEVQEKRKPVIWGLEEDGCVSAGAKLDPGPQPEGSW